MPVAGLLAGRSLAERQQGRAVDQVRLEAGAVDPPFGRPESKGEDNGGHPSVEAELDAVRRAVRIDLCRRLDIRERESDRHTLPRLTESGPNPAVPRGARGFHPAAAIDIGHLAFVDL